VFEESTWADKCSSNPRFTRAGRPPLTIAYLRVWESGIKLFT